MKRFEQRPLVSKYQRGIVLLVTLLALVAMTLASVGMMRSVDTSVTAVGNLGFRQAADAATNTAFECVIQAMQGWANSLNTDNAFLNFDSANGTANNYFASIQPGENPQGIPAALLTASGGVGLCSVGNDIRVIVERMCNSDGAINSMICAVAFQPGGLLKDDPTRSMVFPMEGIGSDSDEVGGGFYRVTVRVNGPKNTTSFSQMFIIF
jgi:Tfp pilus assembly protein PilX